MLVASFSRSTFIYQPRFGRGAEALASMRKSDDLPTLFALLLSLRILCVTETPSSRACSRCASPYRPLPRSGALNGRVRSANHLLSKPRLRRASLRSREGLRFGLPRTAWDQIDHLVQKL